MWLFNLAKTQDPSCRLNSQSTWPKYMIIKTKSKHITKTQTNKKAKKSPQLQKTLFFATGKLFFFYTPCSVLAVLLQVPPAGQFSLAPQTKKSHSPFHTSPPMLAPPFQSWPRTRTTSILPTEFTN